VTVASASRSTISCITPWSCRGTTGWQSREGPACLAGYFAAYRDRETVVGQLEFLINVHRLQRVVLIAHEDCAFYTERLDASPLGLDKRQREDLRQGCRAGPPDRPAARRGRVLRTPGGRSDHL